MFSKTFDIIEMCKILNYFIIYFLILREIQQNLWLFLGDNFTRCFFIFFVVLFHCQILHMNVAFINSFFFPQKLYNGNRIIFIIIIATIYQGCQTRYEQVLSLLYTFGRRQDNRVWEADRFRSYLTSVSLHLFICELG